jgi:hypothetical protein
MSCDRILNIKEGEKLTQPKVKFSSLEEAIKVAKKINLRGENIRKVVAYKCKFCQKYHIGRGKTKLDVSKIKPYWKDAI